MHTFLFRVLRDVAMYIYIYIYIYIHVYIHIYKSCYVYIAFSCPERRGHRYITCKDQRTPCIRSFFPVHRNVTMDVV